MIGRLLVALNSPHLPSHIGAVLLLLTPVGALVLGAVVLGERPTLALGAPPTPLRQWGRVGCALILVSAYATVTSRTRT